jgi:hypothetical protein
MTNTSGAGDLLARGALRQHAVYTALAPNRFKNFWRERAQRRDRRNIRFDAPSHADGAIRIKLNRKRALMRREPLRKVGRIF